jgi:thymidine kinase
VLSHSLNLQYLANNKSQTFTEALYKKGKTIIVSSVQLSAQGNPFEEIAEMMPWATKIEVCPAVCTVTGNDAYFTVRKDGSDKQIEVGGSNLYEPRSWGQTRFTGI